MLDASRSRYEKNQEFPLLSTVTINAEGLALQKVTENGIGKVRPTNGVANSIFMGFSFGYRFPAPATAVKTEAVVVSSAGVATLSRTPTAVADMIVIKGTSYTGTALANVASAPTVAQWKLNGSTVETHVDNAGATLFVVYRYALTVLESQLMFGDAYPGPQGPNVIGSIGVVQTGIIYTDAFDTSVNWAAMDAEDTPIIGGANGRLTNTGAGCSLRGFATVISVPSAGDPWLGIELDR